MSAWGIGLYASDFALDLRATVGAVARLPLDEDKLVAAISRPRKLPPKIPPTRIWLVLADQFEKRLCPPYSAAALTDEVNNSVRSRASGDPGPQTAALGPRFRGDERKWGAIRAAHAGRGTRSPSSASASVSPSGSGLPRVSGKKGTARSPRM
jgi:hypothetical protein